jgi:hypothetical protein
LEGRGKRIAVAGLPRQNLHKTLFEKQIKINRMTGAWLKWYSACLARVKHCVGGGIIRGKGE